MHDVVERQSLALHRLVAERLDDDMVHRAGDRLRRWGRQGTGPHESVAARWHELLGGPRQELIRVLTSPEQHAVDLRQSTPFAGEVPPPERWRILREVR